MSHFQGPSGHQMQKRTSCLSLQFDVTEKFSHVHSEPVGEEPTVMPLQGPRMCVCSGRWDSCLGIAADSETKDRHGSGLFQAQSAAERKAAVQWVGCSLHCAAQVFQPANRIAVSLRTPGHVRARLARPAGSACRCLLVYTHTLLNLTQNFKRFL